MSILAIQRKHAKLFNIRLGKKNGNAPAKLNPNEIRVTSPQKKVVESFAEIYGGRAMRWEEEWQVFMPISRLPIVLLPGQNLTQWMELWGGNVCQRRCDSVRMADGSPCACGSELLIEQRDCKPVSRLTVACPEVPVVGVGLLTTRSLIAAGEMDGALSIAQPILDSGRAVSGILRVDQLKGQGTKYAVPRIELDGITFQDIALAAGSPLQIGLGPGNEALTLTEGG